MISGTSTAKHQPRPCPVLFNSPGLAVAPSPVSAPKAGAVIRNLVDPVRTNTRRIHHHPRVPVVGDPSWTRELECASSCALTCPATSALFSTGEKCEKPLATVLPARLRKRLRNPFLKKNLEDRHRELECHRSARQQATRNSVL